MASQYVTVEKGANSVATITLCRRVPEPQAAQRTQLCNSPTCGVRCT